MRSTCEIIFFHLTSEITILENVNVKKQFQLLSMVSETSNLKIQAEYSLGEEQYLVRFLCFLSGKMSAHPNEALEHW